MSRRKLGTLSRADIGKRITFTSTAGRQVEGVIRAFTHGVFNSPSRGEVDRSLVLVTIVPQRVTQIVAPFGSEAHWAEPDDRAEIITTPANEEARS